MPANLPKPVLIDGYNVLFALGWLRKPSVGPAVLEQARRRLLGFLWGSYGVETEAVTVVFDAAAAPPGAGEEDAYQGIQVRYAVHHPEADDYIEEVIRRSSAPRQMTVVSDDLRIQKAARRSHCAVLGSADFVELLTRARQTARPPPPPKPEKMSAEETKHWLAAFGDLEHDPKFKELFEPWGFEE